jgi:flagellar assembly protein FliH
MAVIKATAQRPTFAGSSLHDLGDLRKGAEDALDRARAEATRLVAEAKREVDKVYSESRESGFEQGKEEGFVAGFAEGRAAGEAAGREEARAAHEAMIKALEESFSAEFMRWVQIREEVMRTAERELAGISIAIAEAIVREHVRCDTAAVVRQVEQAVALFARATRISIEVAPEDEPLVREALPNLCAMLPPDAEVALRARAGIARGGCFIRSSEGTIDARMETLFRRVREGVVGTGAPAAEPASGPIVTQSGAAGTAEAPATPEVSEVPEVPEVSEVSEVPEAAEAAETLESPETPHAPDAPDSPDAPDAPGAPESGGGA